MNHTISKFYVLVATLPILVGCATAPGTIFRETDLNEGKSLSTDSRQRLIANTQVGALSRPGQVDPKQIICAEPSPDVAIAVANSFGAGLSILGKGSGSISGSQAEGLAQLAERTVTVQLLRDQMYRACEAYSNGAISGTTYSLIMSRINDTMVTLLLGETAGGAFGRKLAALGGEAESKAQAELGSLSANAEGVKNSAAELEAANKDVDQKEQIWRDKEKIAGKESATDSEKAEAAQAKQDLDAAKHNRDLIAERLKGQVTTLAESRAKFSQVLQGGGITGKSTAQTAESLVSMQKNFLSDDSTKSLVSACVVELGGQFASLGIHSGKLLDALVHRWEALASEENTMADAALNAVLAQERKLNVSALSQYCQNTLLPFVQSTTKRRLELEAQKFKLATQVDVANELNKLMSTCAEPANDDQKKWCDIAFSQISKYSP